MVYQEQIQLATQGHGQMYDLTDQITQIVKKSAIQVGLVNVFNIGSTGAIGAIEFEPGLTKDLPEILNRLIPPSLDYGHEQAWHDGNGHSHLQATWLGPSLTVPVQAGKPVLGTWQQIFHIDCDNKARHRKIIGDGVR